MNLNKFIEELNKINIDVTPKQLDQLNNYYEMLTEYNNVMNLTNITEKEDVYLKHFYDSLTICKIIDLNKINNICDIGTGAGFPGMVIKIIFPDLNVCLVDSLNKRINFLKEVSKKLKLEKIEIIHDRAEEFSIKNIEKFDCITARAVSHLSNLLEYSVQAIKVNGFFVALKSNVDEELKESKEALKKLDCIIEDKIEFNLPIENSKRTLIKIKKIKTTNKKYPRKYSEIKKKRL